MKTSSASIRSNVDRRPHPIDEILRVRVRPVSTDPVTIECLPRGNTFFLGFGAHNFTPAASILLTSIVSGLEPENRLGGPIDAAFFSTTECYCPFDFGFFSKASPLLMTISPLVEESVLDMIIFGEHVGPDGARTVPPLIESESPMNAIRSKAGEIVHIASDALIKKIQKRLRMILDH